MNEDLTNTLIFKLGKLMIALGWADGKLDRDEVDAMKNMLFRLKGLSAADWAEFEILMENQTSKPDLDFLLQDVIRSIHSENDKKLILDGLRNLIEADGKITPAEQSLFEEIEKAVNAKAAGLLILLGGLGKTLLKNGLALVQKGIKQEDEFHTYIQNKILYDIKKRFPDNASDLSPHDLKKWSAAAALLGRVAMVDNDFDENEKNALVSILQKTWGLDIKIAAIIGELVQKRFENAKTDIHKSLNDDYIARSFFDQTSYEERVRFIELLFQLANVSDKTSFKEIEEIRSIAIDLKVAHSDYIKAKLTISSKDRKGM